MLRPAIYNSSASPANVTVTSIIPIQIERSTYLRNRLLGGGGMLCNMVAVVMLWHSSRIRPSLKMVLIGMSLSDLLLMTIAAVWSPDLPCWPAVYIITSSNLVSYFMTVVLALNNYIAVFYPIRCRQILSPTRSLAIVVSCWLCGYLISLACVGAPAPSIESIKGCLLIAAIPRLGLVAVSCVCLLCSCIIVVFNVRVLKAIRRVDRQSGPAIPRITVDLNQTSTNSVRNGSSMNGSGFMCPRRSRSKLSISNCISFLPKMSELRCSNSSAFEISKRSPQPDKRSIRSDANVYSVPDKEPQPLDISKAIQSVSRRVSARRKGTSGETNFSFKNHKSQYHCFNEDLENIPIPFRSCPQTCQDSSAKKDTRPLQMEMPEDLNTNKINYLQVPSMKNTLSQRNNSAGGSWFSRETIEENKSKAVLPAQARKSSVEQYINNAVVQANSSFVLSSAAEGMINNLEDASEVDDDPNKENGKIRPKILRVKGEENKYHHSSYVNTTASKLTSSNAKVKCSIPSRGYVSETHNKTSQVDKAQDKMFVKTENTLAQSVPNFPRCSTQTLKRCSISNQTTNPTVGKEICVTLQNDFNSVSKRPGKESTLHEHHAMDHSRILRPGTAEFTACHSSVGQTSATSQPPLDLGSSTSAISTQVSDTQTRAKRWRRRTQHTLLILCSWCCFLSLPYIFYIGYVAIWIEDRVNFTSSGLGILTSSLAVLNSITNPFLYAWRFVEGRAILEKWRRKLKRNTL
ncbi:hypothetical protein RRG08_019833 [Elysia crispata]|uniref:G-protein coupled receptors family 1 profile domain-containing protein n=1 Tax=Elysia crispata TaxID=231223 RepID=A0AAE1AXA8_9GAST|nr:hypothetical protein RRG08_019833 [Elysia crispata]